MKVKLLNDGSFSESAEGVKFPVEVEAFEASDTLIGVERDELKRVGFKKFKPAVGYFFEGDEAERLPEPEKGVTVCSITDKCCNQFGERDEIQTIINSLQADVVARGNRITELERALRTTNDELHKTIKKVNRHLENNAYSSDLDDPDYWDFQTVHDNAMLLGDAND